VNYSLRMPLLLPQLSRREFLKRATLAGVAAAFAPALFAEHANKPRDPDTLFFLSDTHVAADVTAIAHGVNMADHLGAVVREILAWPVLPGAIVINGDLAFKTGQPEDYEAFGKLIEPLRVLAPVHLLLGNHDQRDVFWKAFPLNATQIEAVPEKQVAILNSTHANLFLLDSLEVTGARPGRLGTAQLEWLTHELETHPDKPALVVGHHHLDLLGEIGGLKDTSQFAKLLTKHRQVKAYIYGHTHNWHLSQHEQGVFLVNLPPTAYVFEPGRPSGWVRATLAPDGAAFELRSLAQRHSEHAQVKKLSWRA